MNVVSFPGLNLKFEFSKIAFEVFGVAIYKYAICIVLGIFIALFLCKINKEKFDVDYDFILENIVLGVFVGIIGARLYYIIFNFDYYSNNFSEVLNFRNGGVAIYGGLLFGAIAIIINCKIHKKDVLNLFDCIIPYVAIAQCVGRIGNFFNIEAYGYETTSILRMGIFVANEYMEVHPTFLYESTATFIISIILMLKQRKRKYKGQILLTYGILYGMIRFIIEGMRSDSLMFFNLRISQILSAIILMVSTIAMITKKINNNAVSKVKKIK